MGVTPAAYWEMSQSEFLAVLKARNERLEREFSRHKDVLRILRLLATMAYNKNRPKSGQKTPETFIPFSFDKLARMKPILSARELKKEAAQRRKKKHGKG